MLWSIDAVSSPARALWSPGRPDSAGCAGAVEAATRLELTPYAVSPPGWPADLALKIAVIADIHACDPWMPAERIGSIVDLANAQKPDLTVLLGDFVGAQHFVTRYLPPGAWAEQLARLEASLGVYAILGNHDWWSAAVPDRSARQCAERAQRSARRRHSGSRKQPPSRSASTAGRSGLSGSAINWRTGWGGAHARGNDDLAGALRQINDEAPAILLAHEPFIFPATPDRIALTLCGHTHGGQVNLPIIGAPFAPTMRGVQAAMSTGSTRKARAR